MALAELPRLIAPASLLPPFLVIRLNQQHQQTAQYQLIKHWIRAGKFITAVSSLRGFTSIGIGIASATIRIKKNL